MKVATHLLTPETRWRKQIETSWDSGWFPMTNSGTLQPDQGTYHVLACPMVQLHTRAKPAVAEERVQL